MHDQHDTFTADPKRTPRAFGFALLVSIALIASAVAVAWS